MKKYFLIILIFYSCQADFNNKKQEETTTKEVISNSVKTVDNDMINFLSIGNFGPDFIKIVADEINIKYLDYDSHIEEDSLGYSVRLKYGEENPFLIKILKNYLDNNSTHPIEGIYNLIYNTEVGFKVFIYRSNYFNGFFVKVIENKKLVSFNEDLNNYYTKIKYIYKIPYIELTDEGKRIQIEWDIANYPFSGKESYSFSDGNNKSILSLNPDNTFFQNNRIKGWESIKYNKEMERSRLSGMDSVLKTVWPENYIERLKMRFSLVRTYAFIEETSIDKNYIINWTTEHNLILKSPPSIAEFDGKLIKFIVKGDDYYEIFPEFEDNIYKASFLKTYPLDGKHSKSNKESNWAGNGSGLIISKQGHIVTNHHVINGVNSIEVEIKNDDGLKKYNAVVVNSDEETDLAILKIEDEDFKEFSETPAYNFKSGIADSGEKIYAYGYPMALSTMGKEVKVTDGIISSKTGIDGDVKTYQISAPIQPGNSGGPLFDDKGNLLGINSSGLSKEFVDNVGYSIKTNYLLNLIDALPEKIELPYSYTIRWLSNQNQIKRLSKYTVLIKVK